MKAYSLVKNIIEDKFDFTLDEEIGWGAQGQVFSIKGRPDKVIKLSILYDVDYNKSIDLCFDRISKVYNFIINNKLDNLVHIFDFGKLHSGERETVNGAQKYIIYYSVQQKLQSLSEDEKKVFKTVCQAANNELESERAVDDIINELVRWFTFDASKVLKFYNDLFTCPIQNNDFHRRNIMKDGDGNFKLIDFDLAEIEKDKVS